MLTPVETIADALGWTLDRVEAALAQLKADLPTVGLRLHRLRGRVQIVRDETATTPDELQQMLRVHDACSDGMTVGQARVLYAVMQRATSKQLQGNADQRPPRAPPQRRLRHARRGPTALSLSLPRAPLSSPRDAADPVAGARPNRRRGHGSTLP